jgi:hypothetical protein
MRAMSEFELIDFDNLCESYSHYIDGLADGNTGFRLTSCAEASPYARCFALFGFHLLCKKDRLEHGSDIWASAIREDLDRVRQERATAGVDLAFDKPYLQLLAFSLSAMAILNKLDRDPFADHVLPLLSTDIEADLRRAGVHKGKAQSGNLSMFMAILLLHARDWLGIDDGEQIERWRAFHLKTMNRFGFWGSASSISHHQFQNGYHQYEIFQYIRSDVSLWDKVANYVALLADHEGHFAPYPGGGGCYDYDAIFLITGSSDAVINQQCDLLMRTAKTISNEQNPDGGFCESHLIRPRSFENLSRALSHASTVDGKARIERIRYALSLQRSCHNRIHTHWSHYPREWGESNLWDSWFRMLTLARIDVALNPAAIKRWGFIDYPGIGYHQLLSKYKVSKGEG